MMARNSQVRESSVSGLDLALEYLDGNLNAIDLPPELFDPAPTALGLYDMNEPIEGSNPRHSRPEETCIVCGLPQPA